MVFITGGAYQGKKAYVKNMYANIDTMLNGRECSLGDVITARCVYNWQYLIKRVLENKDNPTEFTYRLIKENPGIIIISDEIGCGIVPIDKNERIWREEVGITTRIIADSSDKVVRLVCGLPQILKEKE